MFYKGFLENEAFALLDEFKFADSLLLRGLP